MQFELMLAHRYTLCAVSLHCCTEELHCDKRSKWLSEIRLNVQVHKLCDHCGNTLTTLVRYARKHNVHVCNWLAMHGNNVHTYDCLFSASLTHAFTLASSSSCIRSCRRRSSASWRSMTSFKRFSTSFSTRSVISVLTRSHKLSENWADNCGF